MELWRYAASIAAGIGAKAIIDLLGPHRKSRARNAELWTTIVTSRDRARFYAAVLEADISTEERAEVILRRLMEFRFNGPELLVLFQHAPDRSPLRKSIAEMLAFLIVNAAKNDFYPSWSAGYRLPLEIDAEILFVAGAAVSIQSDRNGCYHLEFQYAGRMFEGSIHAHRYETLAAGNAS